MLHKHYYDCETHRFCYIYIFFGSTEMNSYPGHQARGGVQLFSLDRHTFLFICILRHPNLSYLAYLPVHIFTMELSSQSVVSNACISYLRSGRTSSPRMNNTLVRIQWFPSSILTIYTGIGYLHNNAPRDTCFFHTCQ